VVARLALASLLALIAWGSLADNWRQLAGSPYRLIQMFPSKRVEVNPPAEWVRDITIVLLVLALVFTACLVARHIGGYVTQMALLMIAVVAWLPFFILRQRLDLNLALGFDGSWTSPLDVAGYLLFTLAAWTVDSLVLVMTFMVLLIVVSLPVTLLLDITRLRKPRVRGEANSYFRALSSHRHQP
jgi:cellobiose-specific phosphotransferase system component IIC